MSSGPELSSVATALEELLHRITTMADDYTGGPRDDLARELYEVERGLTAAHRRLTKLKDTV